VQDIRYRKFRHSSKPFSIYHLLSDCVIKTASGKKKFTLAQPDESKIIPQAMLDQVSGDTPGNMLPQHSRGWFICYQCKRWHTPKHTTQRSLHSNN
jgi:hypothetical protein